jgi:hypothetical protein
MKRIVLIALVGIASKSFAQKQSTESKQIWLGYLNQTRLSEKWGLWLDLHLRTKDDFTNNLSQSIIRPGITYYATSNTKLTAGYAYVNHFPADNHANISQPEHRAWQQVQWHNNHPKLRLMQWVRLEEKLRHKIKNNDELAEGYGYNWKMRYNILVAAPLSKNAFAPKTFSFVVNDEVHVNFGKQIVYNYFDQNRFFVGFAYHVNKSDNLQFGYMNLFQQLPAGNQYKNIHAARVFYFHNLDLRKKQP